MLDRYAKLREEWCGWTASDYKRAISGLTQDNSTLRLAPGHGEVYESATKRMAVFLTNLRNAVDSQPLHITNHDT